MKRGGYLSRRTRIRPFSAQRQREREERERVVGLVWYRDRRVCQARRHGLAHLCRGPLDVHEIIPRSAWKKGYLVEENCVLICRAAHEWVDANPEKAHAIGLHGYSWERP